MFNGYGAELKNMTEDHTSNTTLCEYREYANNLITNTYLIMRIYQIWKRQKLTKAAAAAYLIYHDAGWLLRTSRDGIFIKDTLASSLKIRHPNLRTLDVANALKGLNATHDLFVPCVVTPDGTRFYALQYAWETPAAKLAIQSDLQHSLENTSF